MGRCKGVDCEYYEKSQELESGIQQLENDLMGLEHHACMTGDCPHEESYQCRDALEEAIEEFSQAFKSELGRE